jgi:di/tricarboxylate transporter
VVALLLTGCIKWYDATRALSAPVILIIVTSLAMGTAMVETGGADMIASAYVAITAGASPTLILSGLLAMMALLTNVVSNNAAAVIGTPIAIGIAHQLGQPAEPFVLAVLFGANMSFATPMAYQTNLLVMNAGNYSFGDFVRVGLPLVVIMWALLSFFYYRGYTACSESVKLSFFCKDHYENTTAGHARNAGRDECPGQSRLAPGR